MREQGITFNIQRFSTEDGPGIRTTVFFKGCPLRCAWCHNPEGLSPRQELMWHDARCIGARACLGVCPPRALTLAQDGMRIDRQACTACGDCAAACPSGALEVVGRTWTPEALLAEVEKDAVFFETSGGGVTLSGGEPMVQLGFLAAFCRLCRAAGLHVALDTCGMAPWMDYEAVLPYVDLVLYDLKLWDTALHYAATGADNGLILHNARRLAAAGVPLWIRTPIVPGYTAGAPNINALAEFIAGLGSVQRWDLLAYSNLGRPKYARLDRVYALADTALLARAEMERLHAIAVQRVPVAVWSGATRLDVEPAQVVDPSSVGAS
jgi:pyruvate formate lyase activating enzyme